MILPTANGMAKIQSTSQSKAKLDKTQVGDTRCIISYIFRHGSRACTSFLTSLFFFFFVGQISSSSSTSAPVNTGVKIPTCKFSMREKFLTSPADLYRVFLNQEMVQAFTHAPATVDGEKGGKFRLLDGNVFGEFTELVPDEKIVMKWRYNNWPSEHYATITMTFLDRSSETELKVECRGVPDNDEERTKEGWKKYYFEAIKQTFGYGARLF
ncbi:Activator of 90 kDa heat shock protein ATPase-like protein 1 [Nibea albiflora]|uniref:Activator of 90 kDa heat shock protein ATPase-like protein 1 n=1 Tax=Nibea albiflora TaxID=240163 RepID=A0ACB7FF04_NIBAL|nr:Activator of 90 kDa heat shock protein ATPase-like protein 1 [Nibea albiflora]